MRAALNFLAAALIIAATAFIVYGIVAEYAGAMPNDSVYYLKGHSIYAYGSRMDGPAEANLRPGRPNRPSGGPSDPPCYISADGRHLYMFAFAESDAMGEKGDLIYYDGSSGRATLVSADVTVASLAVSGGGEYCAFISGARPNRGTGTLSMFSASSRFREFVAYDVEAGAYALSDNGRTLIFAKVSGLGKGTLYVKGYGKDPMMVMDGEYRSPAFVSDDGSVYGYFTQDLTGYGLSVKAPNAEGIKVASGVRQVLFFEDGRTFMALADFARESGTGRLLAWTAGLGARHVDEGVCSILAPGEGHAGSGYLPGAASPSLPSGGEPPELLFGTGRMADGVAYAKEMAGGVYDLYAYRQEGSTLISGGVTGYAASKDMGRIVVLTRDGRLVRYAVERGGVSRGETFSSAAREFQASSGCERVSFTEADARDGRLSLYVAEKPEGRELVSHDVRPGFFADADCGTILFLKRFEGNPADDLYAYRKGRETAKVASNADSFHSYDGNKVFYLLGIALGQSRQELYSSDLGSFEPGVGGEPIDSGVGRVLAP
ncbi:MAG: hypothetical protein FWE70_05065 [Oscillospiraceae bacterium]|nr:hypothetical protein [Oscillospiraceae bacterium]